MTTTSAAPSATATPEPVGPSAVAKVPAPSGAALRLRVVKGTSWVNVQSSSGEVLFRGVLSPGTAKDFDDPRAARGDRRQRRRGQPHLRRQGRRGRQAGQVRKYTCAAKGLVPA